MYISIYTWLFSPFIIPDLIPAIQSPGLQWTPCGGRNHAGRAAGDVPTELRGVEVIPKQMERWLLSGNFCRDFLFRPKGGDDYLYIYRYKCILFIYIYIILYIDVINIMILGI